MDPTHEPFSTSGAEKASRLCQVMYFWYRFFTQSCLVSALLSSTHLVVLDLGRLRAFSVNL